MPFALQGTLSQFTYTKDDKLPYHWQYSCAVDFSSFGGIGGGGYPNFGQILRPANMLPGTPLFITDPSPTLLYYENNGYIDAVIDLSSVAVAQDSPPKFMSVTLLEKPTEFNYAGALATGPATYGPLSIVFPNGQFQIFQIPVQQIIPNTGSALTNFWASGGSQVWTIPITISQGQRVTLRKYASINAVSSQIVMGLVLVTFSNTNLQT